MKVEILIFFDKSELWEYILSRVEECLYVFAGYWSFAYHDRMGTIV